jgi:hypothetical protein
MKLSSHRVVVDLGQVAGFFLGRQISEYTALQKDVGGSVFNAGSNTTEVYQSGIDDIYSFIHVKTTNIGYTYVPTGSFLQCHECS